MGRRSCTGFEPAPPGHPIAAGLPAGAITDDTEQAVLLGRLLVTGHGTIDPRELAQALVSWERDMAARGSLDLLGPSTKRAVAAVLAGVPPEEAGASGDTNGAAMRIAPVGIAVPLSLPEPAPHHPSPGSDRSLSTLVDQVVAASYVTHNTGLALAGAAAVAAAVSAGLAGAGIAEATALAVRAARIGAERGHWVAGADVAARIEWAAGLVAGRDRAEAAELIYTLVGTSLATQESVPAAFAVLAAVPGRPVAGLPAGRLARRRLRHDRRHGRCDRRCLPRPRGLPGPRHRRHRRPRPGPGRAGRRSLRPALARLPPLVRRRGLTEHVVNQPGEPAADAPRVRR